jgi:uncharacterized protein (DUF2336 family)
MSQPDRLPDILQGLAALGQRGDLEMRPVLLRVLTDLFVSRDSHSRDEIKQYETIALTLIDKTNTPTRVIVAGKLAKFGATPSSVVDRLMEDGGAAATEFLRHSSLVGRSRLMQAAIVGTADAAEAVALRLDLDPEIVGVLAARHEIEIVRALADNLAAPIADDVAGGLVARATRDRTLARILCRRLTKPSMLTPLFLQASPSQRAAIIMGARRADLGNPTRAARDLGEEMDSSELERAAVLRDRPLLSALVARALGTSLPEADEIIGDPRGEPMALILAAMRTPPEAAARIFMMLDPAIAHSHERVRALSHLVVDLPPQVARDILAEMLDKPEPRKRPQHIPVSDATASTSPSRPVNNAREVAAPRRRGLFLARRRA